LGARAKVDLAVRTNSLGSGALLTAAILVGGVVTFTRGGSKQLQQRFMRARVAAQGATLAVIAYGAYETAKAGPPQFDEANYRGNSQPSKS
jgi:hypothetical protein